MFEEEAIQNLTNQLFKQKSTSSFGINDQVMTKDFAPCVGGTPTRDRKFQDCKGQSESSSLTESAKDQVALMSTAYESCSPPKGQAELDLHSSEPFPDFDRHARFPEANILELPVEQKGKELMLCAYRYPPKNYRKGVVFFIHGYGSYANQNGALLKYLAEFDYETFAIDQRGFGSCKGQKCLIEDYEDMYNDQWLLIFEAIKTYKIDQQKTPLFLLGRSFGAMLTTNLANSPIAAKMFTGVGLLQPYYRLYTERLYTHQPLVKLWKFLGPHRLMASEFTDCDPEYAKKWAKELNDPEFTYYWTPTVGVMWVEEQARARESIQDVSLPILMIEAEKDDVVNNDYCREYFALASNRARSDRKNKSSTENKYVQLKDCNHLTMCFDEVAASETVREIVRYFNSLIDEKQVAPDIFEQP